MQNKLRQLQSFMKYNLFKCLSSPLLIAKMKNVHYYLDNWEKCCYSCDGALQ